MKTLFPILIALIATTVMASAQTSSKTLVQSFNLKGKSEMALPAHGQVTVTHWKGNYAQVQVEIELPNATEGKLKSLVATGRYQVETESFGTVLVLRFPGLEKEYGINDISVKDQLRFTVFVPEGVEVEVGPVTDSEPKWAARF